MSKQAFDVATVVTQKMIHLIETQQFQKFTQSWSSRQATHPVNFATKKPYTGVNVWLLGMTEYSRPEWLTYKQAQELGGQVRKGEGSTLACFYSPVALSKEDDDGNRSTYSLLRHFNLFNVEQVDGLELPELPELPKPSGSEAAIFLRKRCQELSVDLRHSGEKAFYNRISDSITMPSTAFVSEAAYSAVLAHELIHATGSPSRLNRKKGQVFGDDDYAFEELVAELGSAFLCAKFGIANEYGCQHASYLAAWLKVLGSDKKAFLKASSLADKAFKLVDSSDSDSSCPDSSCPDSSDSDSSDSDSSCPDSSDSDSSDSDSSDSDSSCPDSSCPDSSDSDSSCPDSSCPDSSDSDKAFI